MTYSLLFVAALLAEMASSIPMGSMPLALFGEGASESQISIVMGSGMFAGLLVSIPVGILVDRVSRILVMKISLVVCALALVVMGLLHGVLAAYLEMAMRALGVIAFMTAQFAYVSAMFSGERKVSAVSSMGIVGNIAFAIGPAFGVWLWQNGIRYEQFLYASILNVLSLALIFTLPAKFDHAPSKGKRVSRRRIYMRAAWLPSMVFILACTLQGGVNFSLAVLAFQERGITNGALLFTASALTAVCFRYFASRVVERYGPRLVAIPTVLSQTAGCFLAAYASTASMVALSGVFLGFAWAAVAPVGIALLFETSSEKTRGTAMGSYNLAMWGGAAGGTLIATGAASIGLGYREAIMVTTVMPLAALLYIFLRPRRISAASDVVPGT